MKVSAKLEDVVNGAAVAVAIIVGTGVIFGATLLAMGLDALHVPCPKRLQ
jgi:hypothetical protein